MRRVVEEPEPVLLRVEEVLDAGGAQRRADRVRLLGVALPARRACRGSGSPGCRRCRSSGSRGCGPCRSAPGGSAGVGHRASPPVWVPAATRPALSSAARICAFGDRAVRALVETEELEALVADRREVREDGREAAGQRRPAGRGRPGSPGTSARRGSPITRLSSRVIESRIANCWTPSRSRGTSRSPLCLSLSWPEAQARPERTQRRRAGRAGRRADERPAADLRCSAMSFAPPLRVIPGRSAAAALPEALRVDLARSAPRARVPRRALRGLAAGHAVLELTESLAERAPGAGRRLGPGRPGPRRGRWRSPSDRFRRTWKPLPVPAHGQMLG